MTYAEKLKDPRWQKKRLEILERDNWQCMCCGAKDETLHVHHIFYFPRCDPWEVHNGFLVTFCKNCHNSRCETGPCERCQDFTSGDCEGAGDPPQEVQECIGTLLNEIWTTNIKGDFFSTLGVVWSRIENG